MVNELGVCFDSAFGLVGFEKFLSAAPPYTKSVPSRRRTVVFLAEISSIDNHARAFDELIANHTQSQSHRQTH